MLPYQHSTSQPPRNPPRCRYSPAAAGNARQLAVLLGFVHFTWQAAQNAEALTMLQALASRRAVRSAGSVARALLPPHKAQRKGAPPLPLARLQVLHQRARLRLRAR